MNWLAIGVGTAAFFVVGAVWYTALFGLAWQREVGLSEAELKSGLPMPAVFALCLLLELLVVMTLGHLFARLDPNPRATMMIATGFGLTIMAPALGIAYLFARKSLKLFLIDAGHFVAGMAAVGAVFVWLD